MKISFKMLAAFGAGVAAWEALVHFSLLANRASPRLFGIRLGPRVNLVQTIVPSLTAVALARYAFGPEGHTPFGLRAIARRVIAERLADMPVEAMLDAADRHYAALASGSTIARTAAGRMNVRMSAYVIGLARAMRDLGLREERVRSILADSVFRVMRRAWWTPDRAMALVHPGDRLAQARLRLGLSRRFYFSEPDWVMRDVPVENGVGVDVERCVMSEFFRAQGEGDLCAHVMCAQDPRLSAGRQLRFERTTTLATGGARCDSRIYAS